MSSAHFKNAVQVDGDLTGPVITTINSNATSTLNSLNTQIATHNSHKASSDQAFTDAETARNAMTADALTANNALVATIDSNKADADSKIATSVADRLLLETKVDNNKSSTDTEIATLNTLHSQDDARLTSVENSLQTIDTDLQAQITTAVNQHNTDLGDALPKIQKLEEYFVIDDTTDPLNPVVRIKAGVAFEVSGSFTHGN